MRDVVILIVYINVDITLELWNFWNCGNFFCRYSSLFHFLLSLRRAQIALQQCWALLMSLRAHTQKLQAVWQLRAHMGFLVDNLQYYVQVNKAVVGILYIARFYLGRVMFPPLEQCSPQAISA